MLLCNILCYHEYCVCIMYILYIYAKTHIVEMSYIYFLYSVSKSKPFITAIHKGYLLGKKFLPLNFTLIPQVCTLLIVYMFSIFLQGWYKIYNLRRSRILRRVYCNLEWRIFGIVQTSRQNGLCHFTHGAHVYHIWLVKKNEWIIHINKYNTLSKNFH